MRADAYIEGAYVFFAPPDCAVARINAALPREDTMKLLRNERAYRRWAKTWDTNGERWEKEAPTSYPCFGYTVVQSYGYEEDRPLYLYKPDVAKMLLELSNDA